MINPLQDFNSDTLRERAMLSASRTAKRHAVKQGYIHMMSFYGALTNDDPTAADGIRIEILSDIPFTEAILYGLYEFFNEMRLLTIYSIWMYNGKDDSLKLLWDGKL